MDTRRSALTLLCCVLLGLPAAGPASAAEDVRPALADTWIDGLNSTGPRGSDLALGICPVANYWIYMRFDVSGLAGTLESAELRMTRISGARPEEISAYRIDEDGWSEATLTGVNRPAPTMPADTDAIAVGEAVAGGPDRWRSAALTQTVLAEAAGDGVLTLMLREDPAQMFDIRHYRSREAAVPDTQKPHLVLTVVPAAVTELHITGGTPRLLQWNAGGSLHDVAGGTLADLRADGGVTAATCLADDLAATNLADPRGDPAPGDGYYYIVRGQVGSTPGSYGEASDGAERVPAQACS